MYQVSGILDSYTTQKKCNKHSILNNAHLLFHTFSVSGVLSKLNWGLCFGCSGPLGKKSDFFCKNQILLETWQRKSGRIFFHVHRIHFLSAVRWIAHAAYGLLAGGCLNVLEAAGPCHVFLSIGSSQHEVHSFIKPIFLQPIFRITKWFGPNKSKSF